LQRDGVRVLICTLIGPSTYLCWWCCWKYWQWFWWWRLSTVSHRSRLNQTRRYR